MGTWGLNPAENDGAWDLSLDIEQVVGRALVKATRRKFRGHDSAQKWSGIGVVSWALDLGFTVPEEAVTTARRWLSEVLDDAEWIASWREPAAARRSVRRWQSAFADRVECAGGKAWAKRGFGSRQRGLLETLVGKARKTRKAPRKARKAHKTLKRSRP